MPTATSLSAHQYRNSFVQSNIMLIVHLCCPRCESGCVCDENVINGYHEDHTSLLHLHRMYVSQHEECVISVQVSLQHRGGDPAYSITALTSVDPGCVRLIRHGVDCCQRVCCTSVVNANILCRHIATVPLNITQQLPISVRRRHS